MPCMRGGIVTKPNTLRKRMLVALFVWEGALLLFDVLAGHGRLSWHINQLGWAIFGAPEDLYSFSNLILPRILAWLLYSTPAALIGIWLFGRLPRQSMDPACRRCGYCLKGLTDPRCPECGEAI